MSLVRWTGLLLGMVALAAFGVSLHQAFVLSTSDAEAGQALWSFNLAMGQALICSWGLAQALRQVADSVPRTFEVLGALTLVLLLAYVA